MYLAIDIGGTKTFTASIDEAGNIIEQIRFETPKEYSLFLEDLENSLAKLTTKEFKAVGIGAPGKIDRDHGSVVAFGNLPWRNIHLKKDVESIVKAPVSIDNDANLAGLSEAMLHKSYNKVLYVTVSTGIGTGFIVGQKIVPELADSEGGHMLFEHDGILEPWEKFASGSAIVERFGKRASEINEEKVWRIIAHNISIGLINLIALFEPDIVVLGGGVGTHYKHYGKYLEDELRSDQTSIVKIPKIIEAKRPEEAVVYGCYYLVKAS